MDAVSTVRVRTIAEDNSSNLVLIDVEHFEWAEKDNSGLSGVHLFVTSIYQMQLLKEAFIYLFEIPKTVPKDSPHSNDKRMGYISALCIAIAQEITKCDLN